MNTPKPIILYLEQHGWKVYTDYTGEFWCKRYPDAPRCKQNIEKPGIQVVLRVHKNTRKITYAIEICGEKPDGQWVNFSIYCIPDEIHSVLDEQVRQLLRAWETIYIEAATPEKKP